MDSSFALSLVDGSDHRRLHVSDGARGYSLDLGIEIGTLESFFSFENRALGTANEEAALLSHIDDGWTFKAAVTYETASVGVTETGRADAEGGQRNLRLCGREKSHLMDCVQRFVIPKSQVKEARIGDKIIHHARRNFYHQFPVQDVVLTLHSGAKLWFSAGPATLPVGFSHVVYLRDEPDAWVLHFRALALAPSHYVLKGCHRWFDRPVPRGAQSIIFAVPGLRDSLLYIRERVSQRIPFQVNGAAELAQDEVLEMNVRWRVENA